jgi:hypothetical protein
MEHSCTIRVTVEREISSVHRYTVLYFDDRRLRERNVTSCMTCSGHGMFFELKSNVSPNSLY